MKKIFSVVMFLSVFVCPLIAREPLGIRYIGCTESLAGMGYSVAVSGDYAYYAANEAGLVVVDISDLENPTQVDVIDTPDFSWKVIAEGNYVYVADGTLGGLIIFDISQPENPVEVANYVPGNCSIRDLKLIDNQLYLVAYGGGLFILDVQDPENPIEIAEFLFQGGCNSLEIKIDEQNQTYAYIAAENVTIYNITNVQEPITLGHVEVPHFEGRLIDMALDDNILYATTYLSSGLAVIDISEPDEPVLREFINTDGFARSVVIKDHLAYVTSDNYAELNIFDLSDPLNIYQRNHINNFNNIEYYDSKGCCVRDNHVFMTVADQLFIYETYTPNPILGIDASIILDNGNIIEDTGNKLGLDINASDDFDEGVDIPEEDPVQANYISVYLSQTLWDPPNNKLQQEYRYKEDDLNDQQETFRLIVETNQLNEEVVLDFELFENDEDIFIVDLYDELNERRLNLNTNQSYTFTAVNQLHYFDIIINDELNIEATFEFPDANEQLYTNQGYNFSWNTDQYYAVNNVALNIDYGNDRTSELFNSPYCRNSYYWQADLPIITSDEASLTFVFTDIFGNISQYTSPFTFSIEQPYEYQEYVAISASRIQNGLAAKFDTYNLAAFENNGSSNFDNDLDIIESERPIDENFIELYFPHPEYELENSNLNIDTRRSGEELINDLEYFNLEIASAVLNDSLLLDFSIAEQLNENLGIILYDSLYDHYQNIRNQPFYYHIPTDSLTGLQLIVGDATDPVVNFVYPQADEVIDASQPVKFTWDIEDVSIIQQTTLLLSFDDGTNWIELYQSEDILEGFEWQNDDNNLATTTARLRVLATDIVGNSSITTTDYTFSLFAENAVDGYKSDLPKEFSVSPGYPNPFNSSISVPFALPQSGEISFKVFNTLGQELINVSRNYPAGYHTFNLDAEASGINMVSGLYFIKIKFKDQITTQKIALLK